MARTITVTVTDDQGLTSTKVTQFTVSPAATLQCESAPGTGEFASCALELLDDATVTVKIESRSCDAHGNEVAEALKMPPPLPMFNYAELINSRRKPPQ